MILLKPILYFSLFKYPLTEEEIFAFSEVSTKEQVKKDLEQLVVNKVIFNIDGFYLCENDKSQIKRRLLGNKMAKGIFKKAIKISKLISKFPFVEGVGISGSLSKGYYDKDGDIDFFIITTPNRLWIARTLLILYKKLFLLNSKKYFCVNYFISSSSLEIQEKNRFTATELVTLMPIYGNGSFHEFYKKNTWVHNFLPNKSISKSLVNMNVSNKPLFTRGVEKLLKTSVGDKLDEFFLTITYRKWKLKFNYLEERHFNVALKSTKNVSKHHPQNFQRTVIERLNLKYDEYFKKHNIYIAKEHA